MKTTMGKFFTWSMASAGVFLLIELSMLLIPFTVLPAWAMYILAILVGFFVINGSEDFKVGFFANLEGAVIATVAYFWIGKFMLQNVGNMPAVMATNAALTSIITKSMTIYIFSILGNLAGFLISGII